MHKLNFRAVLEQTGTYGEEGKKNVCSGGTQTDKRREGGGNVFQAPGAPSEGDLQSQHHKLVKPQKCFLSVALPNL